MYDDAVPGDGGAGAQFNDDPVVLIFPTWLFNGIASGPEFSATVVRTLNYRYRMVNWRNSRRRASLDGSNVCEEFVEQVEAFSDVVLGQFNTFLFRDELMHVLDDELIGMGDMAQTDFQITKTLTYLDETVVRDITFPDHNYPDTDLTRSELLQVTVDGTPNTVWTVNRNTGIISFTVAPDAALEIRVSGSYFHKMRITADAIPMQYVGGEVYTPSGGVELIQPKGQL